jgi:hypothetical protein
MQSYKKCTLLLSSTVSFECLKVMKQQMFTLILFKQLLDRMVDIKKLQDQNFIVLDSHSLGILRITDLFFTRHVPVG